MSTSGSLNTVSHIVPVPLPLRPPPSIPLPIYTSTLASLPLHQCPYPSTPTPYPSTPIPLHPPLPPTISTHLHVHAPYPPIPSYLPHPLPARPPARPDDTPFGFHFHSPPGYPRSACLTSPSSLILPLLPLLDVSSTLAPSPPSSRTSLPLPRLEKVARRGSRRR